MQVNTLQAMRVRTQQQQVTPADNAALERGQAAPSPAPCPPAPPQGTLHELAAVVRAGGWQALFSGLQASLFGTATSQGIYFYL